MLRLYKTDKEFTSKLFNKTLPIYANKEGLLFVVGKDNTAHAVLNKTSQEQIAMYKDQFECDELCIGCDRSLRSNEFFVSDLLYSEFDEFEVDSMSNNERRLLDIIGKLLRKNENTSQ